MNDELFVYTIITCGMSAQSKLDILLDCILRVYARYVCPLCDHHFVLSYRGMEVVDKKIIIGISFVRNVIFIENSLFLKMMPGGFKKKHILAALYTSVPLHKH